MTKRPSLPRRTRRVRTLRTELRERAAILDNLRVGFTGVGACAKVGVPYRTAQGWRQSDHDFDEAWRAAKNHGNCFLEDTARDWAVEGELRPLIANGRALLDAAGKPMMYPVRSERMLELLLRARRPETFGSRLTLDGGLDVAVSARESLRQKLDAIAAQMAAPPVAIGFHPHTPDEAGNFGHPDDEPDEDRK